jgi:ribosome-binding protein aMBF1 (putative translation factor)
VLGLSETGLCLARFSRVPAVTKSVFTAEYEQFRKRLVAGRNAKGLTQSQVADKLGKPQSFVSKYERGARRLDLVEFLEVARALGMDPKKMIDQLRTD